MLDEMTLRGLEVSDRIDAGPLLKGLTEEPVKLLVTAVSDTEIYHVEFEASYLGIPLGVWTCRSEPLGITWTGLPK
jgi:hypothetical protein